MILDSMPYHKEREYVTWKTCSTREWLNTAFYETLDEVNLDTQNATPMQKDLCISFARKFNTLNDSQIDKIRKILEGSNK